MPIMVHTPNQSNSKTGVPPIFMNADGNALTAWSISGQTVQTGTPTHDNPIMPEFVGVRTRNLFDTSTVTLGKYINAQGVETKSTAMTQMGSLNHTDYIEIQPNTNYTYHYKFGSGIGNTIALCWFDASKNLISRNTKDIYTQDKEYTLTGTSPANAVFCIINFAGYIPNESMELSFNSGTTPLPYEPYGYKIPITCGGQTTSVYLGQAQTVRRVRKLVLTGEESFFRDKERADSWRFYSDRLISAINNVSICSHFTYIGTSGVNDSDTIGFSLFSSAQFGCRCPKAIADTITKFKAFLAAQYAAGTPVCVWYVLAEPETAIINEPLAKIGDYVDTVASTNTGAPSIPTSEGYQNLTVGTTVQPSNVSVSYNLPELSECSHIYVKTDGLPQTKTGTTPMTFKANGQPLTAYTIIGNGQQTGTPTPSAPIMPEFVGVRTGNLCSNIAYKTNYSINTQGVEAATLGFNIYSISCNPNTTYTISLKSPLSGSVVRIHTYNSGVWIEQTETTAIQYMPLTFTTPNNADEIRVSINGTANGNIMLNLGYTALQYEPYGWAEKITCAGQTVPIYLGQTQTVRRVRKLVLDGTEDWIYMPGTTNINSYYRFKVGSVNSVVANAGEICTHYEMKTISTVASSTDIGFSMQNSTVYKGTFAAFRPYAISSEDKLARWKSYLAQQHATGTPVTVWYVLSEPETAIVNEPLAKIGDYADTVASTNTGAPSIPTVDGANALSVDTTAQPSSVTIGYGAPKYSEVTSAPDAAGVLVYTT